MTGCLHSLQSTFFFDLWVKYIVVEGGEGKDEEYESNTHPAAKTILKRTKCQNSFTAPIKNIAIPNIIVQIVSIRILFHLSATIPKNIPKMVKTAMNEGPARI